MKLTAVIEQGENGWFVGQVEQIRAALAQSKSIEKVKSNLVDALKLMPEVNKDLTEKSISGKPLLGKS